MNDEAVYRTAPATPGQINITSESKYPLTSENSFGHAASLVKVPGKKQTTFCHGGITKTVQILVSQAVLFALFDSFIGWRL